ncbi:MAG: RimK family alpha-L-glutamate ligase [Oligoflexia bacterium]|nr:RimK family alpha-L-glutamate ligase [Oligoflexia bacterium]
MARSAKISLLSFVLDSFSIRRLRQAASIRDHSVKLLDASQLHLHCDGDGLNVLLGGKPVPPMDILIPRLGAISPSPGISVVRQFEESGTFSLTAWRSLLVSREKFATTQLLAQHKVPVPASALVSRASDVASAIALLGGPPVIVKLNRGTQGIGVMLADSAKAAEAIFETMQINQKQVIIQRFVAESRGRDIRAFVVGGKVVAAMRRIARDEEFRSNFHRGGRVEPVKLEPSFEAVAVKAAEVLGLQVAGVDILEGKDGPLVMELNSSPGLEGIESATNKDVAGALIEYSVKSFAAWSKS